MRKPITRWIAPLAVLALAMTACDDGGPTEAADDLSIELKVVSGSDQTAIAGTELTDPLVVKVERMRGWGHRKRMVPKPHHLVNFVVVEGGGSVFAGAATTSWKGIAQEYWTLGSEPGPNVLEVRSVNPYTGEKEVYATFTAIGVCPAVTVTVDPATKDLFADETVLLAATFDDGKGNTPTGCRVSWTSSDGDIAAVDQEGFVTAGAQTGTATITATPIDGGTPGTADVTVVPAPVELVELSLAVISIDEGSSVEVTATVTAGGIEVFDRVVTWTTEDESVATVWPETGLTTTVTGVDAGGPIQVRATSEGVYDEVAVTITGTEPVLHDVEYNGDFATASPLGTVTEGEGTRTFFGNFAEDADQYDYYSLTAVEDESQNPACDGASPDQWTLTVRLKDIPAEGQDYDLVLYDGGKGFLDDSEEFGSTDEEIVQFVGPTFSPCTTDDSADFFIRVREYDGPAHSGPYRLEVTFERIE